MSIQLEPYTEPQTEQMAHDEVMKTIAELRSKLDLLLAQRGA